MMSSEEKMEADGRSIYVGNVDYGATAEQLEAHFYGCGPLNRVTILCDKFTDFAYIEFADEESARTATLLDESLFRGKPIKVCAKYRNRRGISTKGSGFRARDYSGYTPKGRGWAFRGTCLVPICSISPPPDIKSRNTQRRGVTVIPNSSRSDPCCCFF